MKFEEMSEIVASFLSPDGMRRVLIIKRSDSHFTYIVDKLTYHYSEDLRERLEDYGMVWAQASFGGIYETSEAAEREAIAIEKWLPRRELRVGAACEAPE